MRDSMTEKTATEHLREINERLTQSNSKQDEINEKLAQQDNKLDKILKKNADLESENTALMGDKEALEDITIKHEDLAIKHEHEIDALKKDFALLEKELRVRDSTPPPPEQPKQPTPSVASAMAKQLSTPPIPEAPSQPAPEPPKPKRKKTPEELDYDEANKYLETGELPEV